MGVEIVGVGRAVGGEGTPPGEDNSMRGKGARVVPAPRARRRTRGVVRFARHWLRTKKWPLEIL